MKIKFLTSILFTISSFLHSQGITSIYSFDVDNQNDIPNIVQAMTEHFETDFAKAISFVLIKTVPLKLISELLNVVIDSKSR